MPPAVTIMFSPAITSVEAPTTSSGSTPCIVSGFPALPDLHDAPIADADVGLDDAPMVDDQRVGDHQIQRAACARVARAALPHTVSNDLAASEGDLIAIGREILLDFDDQFGIGQPHAVALSRAVQDPRRFFWESRGSLVFPPPLWPSTNRSPANSTKRTSFSSPGSNLTEVPAGMFRRMPRAAPVRNRARC